MPRGFKGVRQANAAIKARREAGGAFGPNALYFSLPDDGDTGIVRFLEENDDIAWCWVHEIPVEGRQYGRDVPCLDQDDEDLACPGCEKEVKRKFKGFINVIWFDAPVYKKDKEGKTVKDSTGDKVVTGTADQVAVWTSGPRLFEELDEINDAYRGLRSRRFKIKRKGVKLDTKYVIKPEDPDGGKQPFTDEEEDLEQKAYDLNEFMKIPTYEDFVKILSGGVGDFSTPNNGRSREDAVADAKSKNPFMRKRAS